MDIDWIIAGAVLALLAGLGLLAREAWRRHRLERRESQAIDLALIGPPVVVAPTPEDSSGVHWWQHAIPWLRALGERFESGRLGQALITPEDRLLLAQIHRNTPQGRAVFLGLRIALAALTPIPALLWFAPHNGFDLLLVVIGALAFGLIAPKLVLGVMASRLRKRVDDELPLLVDLLRLLQGVGFSVDQSMQMVGDRFREALPILARELREANVSYARGRTRQQSLHRLCEFDNDNMRGLVQIIVQVHEHGGAVQEPLRQFVDRMREQRKLYMKEQSGKLSVKMTVVMMLTLLPALMLVLSGPAIISLIDSMTKFRGH
ncbi:type II secretion system F family protein [Dyella sp. ASV21]|uniref:type II secretion system F family protein n=1 Tax=Dyella sp. ASV21 TaxID=2795114 RepID=UPI0018EE45B8